MTSLMQKSTSYYIKSDKTKETFVMEPTTFLSKLSPSDVTISEIATAQSLLT